MSAELVGIAIIALGVGVLEFFNWRRRWQASSDRCEACGADRGPETFSATVYINGEAVELNEQNPTVLIQAGDYAAIVSHRNKPEQPNVSS